MQLKRLITLFTFLSFSFIAFAQNSTVSGTVVDSKTLKPITDAKIIIEGFDAVTSNSLGNFQIWNLPYGEYSLRVTNANYSTFYDCTA